MAEILSFLQKRIPTETINNESFYVDYLKSIGVRTDRMKIPQLMGHSTERIDAIERLLSASEKDVLKVAAEVLERDPLSVNLLYTTGTLVKGANLKFVIGAAIKAIAARPTSKAREAADPSIVREMDLKGYDLMIDAAAESEQYHLTILLLTRIPLDDKNFLTICSMAVRTVVASDHPDAERVFERCVELLYGEDDAMGDMLAAIALAAQVFREGGDSVEFRQQAMSLELERDLRSSAQNWVDQLERCVPGFADALAPYLEGALNKRKPLARDLGLSPTGNVMRDIWRHASRQNFESDDEIFAYIQSFTGKVVPPIPFNELTPEELVEDLVDEALQLPDDEARSALRGLAADHPDAVLPWLALSEIAETASDRLAMANEGIARSSKFYEAEYEAEHTGHYWGMYETRPYIKLLHAKAHALCSLGEYHESMTVCDQILKLNPHDNKGVRFIFMPLLLMRARRDDLERFDSLATEFQMNEDDPYIQWLLLLRAMIRKDRSEVGRRFLTTMAAFPIFSAMICRIHPDQFTLAWETDDDTESTLATLAYMQLHAWAKHPDIVKQLKRMVMDMMAHR